MKGKITMYKKGLFASFLLLLLIACSSGTPTLAGTIWVGDNGGIKLDFKSKTVVEVTDGGQIEGGDYKVEGNIVTVDVRIFKRIYTFENGVLKGQRFSTNNNVVLTKQP
jgi:hypothetical protein